MFQQDFNSYDYVQLAQDRPSGTSATSILSPASGERIVVAKIIIANTTGSAAAYSIYHDEDGTTYDQSTALAYGETLNGNKFDVLELDLAMVNSTGNLAVQTSTGSALTFTLYGYKKRS